MKKLALVFAWALAFSLLVGLVATPASAAPYPPKKPTCQVSDTTLRPGDQVTVSGKHWKPGSTVTITLQPEGINLGSATVGTNGKFSAVVTIPATVQPGAHRIVCSGINRKGNPAVAGTDVQILAAIVSTGGAGGSAFTGTILNVPVWMALIAALLVLGAAFVFVSRRRRRGAVTRP
jgi:alpha-L-fucosidase